MTKVMWRGWNFITFMSRRHGNTVRDFCLHFIMPSLSFTQVLGLARPCGELVAKLVRNAGLLHPGPCWRGCSQTRADSFWFTEPVQLAWPPGETVSSVLGLQVFLPGFWGQNLGLCACQAGALPNDVFPILLPILNLVKLSSVQLAGLALPPWPVAAVLCHWWWGPHPTPHAFSYRTPGCWLLCCHLTITLLLFQKLLAVCFFAVYTQKGKAHYSSLIMTYRCFK